MSERKLTFRYVPQYDKSGELKQVKIPPEFDTLNRPYYPEDEDGRRWGEWMRFCYLDNDTVEFWSEFIEGPSPDDVPEAYDAKGRLWPSLPGMDGACFDPGPRPSADHLPDWTQKAPYDKLIGLTPQQWAWEFLRRADDYAFYWKFYPVQSEIARRYGLVEALDPTKSYLEVEPQFVTAEPRAMLLNPESWVVTTFDLPPYHAAIIIDLRKDIDQQLNHARPWLEKQRPPPPANRLRTDLYLKYLQVLDGLARGASLREIAKVIFPRLENSSDQPAYNNVRNYERAARELSERRYRALATGK
jgi:hypothetical protein